MRANQTELQETLTKQRTKTSRAKPQIKPKDPAGCECVISDVCVNI